MRIFFKFSKNCHLYKPNFQIIISVLTLFLYYDKLILFSLFSYFWLDHNFSLKILNLLIWVCLIVVFIIYIVCKFNYLHFVEYLLRMFMVFIFFRLIGEVFGYLIICGYSNFFHFNFKNRKLINQYLSLI